MTAAPTSTWHTWRHQIDSFFSEFGFLPAPTAESLDIPFDIAADCWIAADTNLAELAELCRLPDAMGSPVERSAVVLFLAHMTEDQPYLRLPEEEEAERRLVIQNLFAEAVGLFPVDQVDEPWRVRWELLSAAKAGLWNRVEALVRRWIAVAPAEERDALTTWAQISFLSVHPARPDDWVTDWWCPYEGSQYGHVGEVFAGLYAARLDHRVRLSSEAWQVPRAISKDDFSRVLNAEHVLLRLKVREGQLNPTQRLIQAWCSALAAVRLGSPDRLREAARAYAEAARGEMPMGLLDIPDKMRRFPAWSAAMLFMTLGDLDSARDAAMHWTEVDRESPESWRFRAEIERRLGLETWADSYEHYVRLSPDTEASWEHSELLRLLLESRDATAEDRAVRALALEHPDRSVVEEMLRWDWDTYPQLHGSTRERWWDGLVLVCDERVRLALRRTPWRYAASCFGEAVSLELRVRIFGPLAASPALHAQVLTQAESRLVSGILGSKATLGAMIAALDLTNRNDSNLGRIVADFLNKGHRPLRAHMRSRGAVEKLRAAADIRNEAVHADISSDEAKALYVEARRFLDMLVKADPSVDR